MKDKVFQYFIPDDENDLGVENSSDFLSGLKTTEQKFKA